MYKFITFVITIAVSSLSVMNASAPMWKSVVINEVHLGNFSKAQSILNSIPPKEMKKYAYLIDSISETMDRIRYDFSLEPSKGIELLNQQLVHEGFPAASDEIINYWKEKKYLEVMNIDGKEWWFRKAIGNLWLLDKEDFRISNILRKKKEYAETYDNYIKFMSVPADAGNVRDWHNVNASFSLTVKANAVPEGQIIRAWLPYPFENGRQKNIKLISSSAKPKFSKKKSLHHTIYMEQRAVKDQPTRFDINFTYQVGAQTFPYNTIIVNMLPYDTKSKLYRKYTQAEYPHILVNAKIRDLAKQIIDKEKNPLLQASDIYNWITKNYPWAGARNYSTIPCLSEYVLNNGHGDCGQVSLLYISLLRSIGIPARWESGWVISSKETGYHDWAEIYFEGVGWVPSDVSEGRTVRDEVIGDFYKTGTDNGRMATNQGISAPLYPRKKFIRNETVDFQAGEVEWKGGNIPTKFWDSDLKINKFESINN